MHVFRLTLQSYNSYTMNNQDRYAMRGVSAQKEEVHAAVSKLDKGLYPKAFCKIYPDYWGGDEAYCNIMHADGAGTKSVLAYMYWKETGDLSVWKGIAIDSIVMNIDDMLCVGAVGPYTYSSTIGRNKHLIPGEVIAAIINGSQEFFDVMRGYGIDVHFMGGETADVGDVVRTMAVNGTMAARWPKSRLVTNDGIRAGDVIVGLASFGQAKYENSYNSGLASNGLTSARHDVLNKSYGQRFPESFDNGLDDSVVYIGPHSFTEEVKVNDQNLTIGQLLLSPTRTFAPVLKKILEENFEAVHGLIHCSGGGQTKGLKYLPAPLNIIKDDLHTPPVIFDLIRSASGADDREMYQVFNMGTRLEIYTSEKEAQGLIDIAASFGVEAKVIGRVEASSQKELELHLPDKPVLQYSH